MLFGRFEPDFTDLAGSGFCSRLLSGKVPSMVRVRGRRLQEVAERFRARFYSSL